MDLKDLKSHMDARFDEVKSDLRDLNGKIDPYASRLSVLETNMAWLKGHLNVSSALIMSVGSGVLIWWLTK